MNDDVRHDAKELPLALVRQLNAFCDKYEQRLAAAGALGFADLAELIDPQARDELICELVGLAAERLQQRGETDPVGAIIAQNPGFEAEVEAAFARHSEVNRAAQNRTVRQPTPAAATPQGRKSRGLRVRCPHCSNHIELLGDTPLQLISCNVCGSTFSLVDRSKETRLAQPLQKIDRFELISRVGVGGFGTVWKARDVELDRTVAVKIPRQGQLTPAEMEQFLREARSAAQLRHPNIVPVHEVGRDGDAIFIVSDIVRGVSLADILTSGRPSPREAAQLCATVAEALEHAHRRGVIHRDLKPSNIMMGDDGTPYLMDFGLAKREVEEVTMTVEGQIIGTPAYMSPEQASGRSAWADRRTDLYSLGVILFELLTGELPFRGNAQMQVYRRLRDDAPSVRGLNRHVPRDLATICAKCLEREPGRRYQTAKDVADELRRFLDKIPIRARPVSRPERLLRWAARRPLQATLAGLALFLAVAGPSTALVIYRQDMERRELVAKQGRLINELEQERRRFIAHAGRLEDRLDVWEGRANPWALWPPNGGEPPKRQQIASLLAARGAALEKPSGTVTPIEEAQRLLALATMYEVLGDNSNAERRLLDAEAVLQEAYESQPRLSRAALALADCYDRLSAVTAVRDRRTSNAWMKRALDLRRTLAHEHPGNPLLAALRLDAELRSGVAAGFASAQEQLAEAGRLNAGLAALWPQSPAAIYRLACQLAGRPAFLVDESGSQVKGASTPSD